MDAKRFKLRGYNKVNMRAWVFSLDKDGFISCPFQNCNYMAFDVEEMAEHYSYCTGNKAPLPHVCQHCGRATEKRYKLLDHIVFHHYAEATSSEILESESMEVQQQRRAVSKVLQLSWKLSLEFKHYIKCHYPNCLFITDNIGDMEYHHLSLCTSPKGDDAYTCEQCFGRADSPANLNKHNLNAHKVPYKSNLISRRIISHWRSSLTRCNWAKCVKNGCNFMATNLAECCNHFISFHKEGNKIELVSCNECEVLLSSEEKLQDHINAHHPMDPLMLPEQPGNDINVINKESIIIKEQQESLPRDIFTPSIEENPGSEPAMGSPSNEDATNENGDEGEIFIERNDVERRCYARSKTEKPIPTKLDYITKKPRGIDCPRKGIRIAKIQLSEDFVEKNSSIIEKPFLGRRRSSYTCYKRNTPKEPETEIEKLAKQFEDSPTSEPTVEVNLNVISTDKSWKVNIPQSAIAKEIPKLNEDLVISKLREDMDRLMKSSFRLRYSRHMYKTRFRDRVPYLGSLNVFNVRQVEPSVEPKKKMKRNRKYQYRRAIRRTRIPRDERKSPVKVTLLDKGNTTQEYIECEDVNFEEAIDENTERTIESNETNISVENSGRSNDQMGVADVSSEATNEPPDDNVLARAEKLGASNLLSPTSSKFDNISEKVICGSISREYGTKLNTDVNLVEQIEKRDDVNSDLKGLTLLPQEVPHGINENDSFGNENSIITDRDFKLERCNDPVTGAIDSNKLEDSVEGNEDDSLHAHISINELQEIINERKISKICKEVSSEANTPETHFTYGNFPEMNSVQEKELITKEDNSKTHNKEKGKGIVLIQDVSVLNKENAMLESRNEELEGCNEEIMTNTIATKSIDSCMLDKDCSSDEEGCNPYSLFIDLERVSGQTCSDNEELCQRRDKIHQVSKGNSNFNNCSFRRRSVSSEPEIGIFSDEWDESNTDSNGEEASIGSSSQNIESKFLKDERSVGNFDLYRTVDDATTLETLITTNNTNQRFENSDSSFFDKLYEKKVYPKTNQDTVNIKFKNRILQTKVPDKNLTLNLPENNNFFGKAFIQEDSESNKAVENQQNTNGFKGFDIPDVQSTENHSKLIGQSNKHHIYQSNIYKMAEVSSLSKKVLEEIEKKREEDCMAALAGSYPETSLSICNKTVLPPLKKRGWKYQVEASQTSTSKTDYCTNNTKSGPTKSGKSEMENVLESANDCRREERKSNEEIKIFQLSLKQETTVNDINEKCRVVNNTLVNQIQATTRCLKKKKTRSQSLPLEFDLEKTVKPEIEKLPSRKKSFDKDKADSDSLKSEFVKGNTSRIRTRSKSLFLEERNGSSKKLELNRTDRKSARKNEINANKNTESYDLVMSGGKDKVGKSSSLPQNFSHKVFQLQSSSVDSNTNDAGMSKSGKEVTSEIPKKRGRKRKSCPTNLNDSSVINSESHIIADGNNFDHGRRKSSRTTKSVYRKSMTENLEVEKEEEIKKNPIIGITEGKITSFPSVKETCSNNKRKKGEKQNEKESISGQENMNSSKTQNITLIENEVVCFKSKRRGRKRKLTCSITDESVSRNKTVEIETEEVDASLKEEFSTIESCKDDILLEKLTPEEAGCSFSPVAKRRKIMKKRGRKPKLATPPKEPLSVQCEGSPKFQKGTMATENPTTTTRRRGHPSKKLNPGNTGLFQTIKNVSVIENRKEDNISISAEHSSKSLIDSDNPSKISSSPNDSINNTQEMLSTGIDYSETPGCLSSCNYNSSFAPPEKINVCLIDKLKKSPSYVEIQEESDIISGNEEVSLSINSSTNLHCPEMDPPGGSLNCRDNLAISPTEKMSTPLINLLNKSPSSGDHVEESVKTSGTGEISLSINNTANNAEMEPLEGSSVGYNLAIPSEKLKTPLINLPKESPEAREPVESFKRIDNTEVSISVGDSRKNSPESFSPLNCEELESPENSSSCNNDISITLLEKKSTHLHNTVRASLPRDPQAEAQTPEGSSCKPSEKVSTPIVSLSNLKESPTMVDLEDSVHKIDNEVSEGTTIYFEASETICIDNKNLETLSANNENNSVTSPGIHKDSTLATDEHSENKSEIDEDKVLLPSMENDPLSTPAIDKGPEATSTNKKDRRGKMVTSYTAPDGTEIDLGIRIDGICRLDNPQKKVKCETCGEVMTAKAYQKEHMPKHNYMCWLEGEVPLPFDNFEVMEVFLNRGKRGNPKKSFKCEKCNEIKKSTRGFLSHWSFCGKTTEERDKLLETCELCGRKMMHVSMGTHMLLSHTNRHQNRNDDKNGEEKGDLSTKRKAAAKCLDLMSNYDNDQEAMEGKACEVCDMYFRTDNKYKAHMRKVHSEDGYDSSSEHKKGDDDKRAITAREALEWTREMRILNYSETVVHPNLVLSDELLKVMNESDSRCFLPELEKSVRFCIEKGEWSTLERFNSVSSEDKEILFCGGSVWGIGWAPTKDSTNQYLAICTSNQDIFHTPAMTPSYSALIQLWAFPGLNNVWSDGNREKAYVAYGIGHKYGAVWGLDWCPAGGETEDRLGLLALATSKGDVPIYAMQKPKSISEGKPFPIFNVKPVVVLQQLGIEKHQCTCVSWSKIKPHSLVAGAYTNGFIAVWDLDSSSALLKQGYNIFPYLTFQAHLSIISGLCFITSSPDMLISCSVDRYTSYWDLKDTSAPTLKQKKGLARDTAWLPHCMCCVTGYDDGYKISGNGTLSISSLKNFGTQPQMIISHVQSSVWNIATNDWLNSFAISYDNGCVLFIFEASEDKRKPAKVLVQSLLVDLKNEQSVEKQGAEKKKKKQKSKASDFLNDSTSYEETAERFGVNFRTDMHYSKTLLSADVPNRMDVYPLAAGNKICWNPNAENFLNLAVGYQSGFVLISRLEIPNMAHYWTTPPKRYVEPSTE